MGVSLSSPVIIHVTPSLCIGGKPVNIIPDLELVLI